MTPRPLNPNPHVADWLVAEGLAKARSWNDDGTYAGADELIEITDAGREALR